jgi:NAD+ diphosphatase
MRLPVQTFAGNPLDRAHDRRLDQDWLNDRLHDQTSVALAVWNGAVLLKDGALARLPADLAHDLSGGDEHLLFLGLEADGSALFALDLEGAADPAAGPLMGLGQFSGLREAAALLAAPEAGMACTAKAVFEWRRRHRFCSNCGNESRVTEAGWKRICPACGTEHFPRTDPVVIMLPVRDGKCLLGRQASWPKGRYSALAGFVEPGESLEEACAREVKEETGLIVTGVDYRASQPWPFPNSLMIGLQAEVAEGEAAPDQTELEALIWLDKAQARDLMAGRIEGLSGAPPLAIAHWLLKDWCEE